MKLFRCLGFLLQCAVGTHRNCTNPTIGGFHFNSCNSRSTNGCTCGEGRGTLDARVSDGSISAHLGRDLKAGQSEMGGPKKLTMSWSTRGTAFRARFWQEQKRTVHHGNNNTTQAPAILRQAFRLERSGVSVFCVSQYYFGRAKMRTSNVALKYERTCTSCEAKICKLEDIFFKTH